MRNLNDIIGLEIRVHDYKIEKKNIAREGEPVNEVDTLSFIFSVDGLQDETQTTSKVMIDKIKGMTFPDAIGKQTRVQRGIGKSGNTYYFFERV